MILLVLIAFILAGLVSARAGAGRDREPVYLSRECTSLVNGVFIWLVFIRHFSGYGAELSGVDAAILRGEGGVLGLLLVAPFFLCHNTESMVGRSSLSAFLHTVIMVSSYAVSPLLLFPVSMDVMSAIIQ